LLAEPLQLLGHLAQRRAELGQILHVRGSSLAQRLEDAGSHLGREVLVAADLRHRAVDLGADLLARLRRQDGLAVDHHHRSTGMRRGRWRRRRLCLTDGGAGDQRAGDQRGRDEDEQAVQTTHLRPPWRSTTRYWWTGASIASQSATGAIARSK